MCCFAHWTYWFYLLKRRCLYEDSLRLYNCSDVRDASVGAKGDGGSSNVGDYTMMMIMVTVGMVIIIIMILVMISNFDKFRIKFKGKIYNVWKTM